jgi:glycerol-3-phosphate dehydrogenase
VVTLDDVLTRRLGMSLVRPDEAAANARGWAAEIAPILGWSAEECDRQVVEYCSGLDRFRDPRRVAQ